jgi:hypothetical protein
MPDWTYAGRRIYVQEYASDHKQIIPRLNPIGDGTIMQIFGYDERILKINAYVVGWADMTALRLLTTSGVAFDLVTPMEGTYEYYCSSVSDKLTKGICQTLRPDLPEDSPVYIADLELYYDG